MTLKNFIVLQKNYLKKIKILGWEKKLMKRNLYNEIFAKAKIIFFIKKKINLKKLKILVNNQSREINKFKKGIVSISTKNKLEFIINFYACNKN